MPLNRSFSAVYKRVQGLFVFFEGKAVGHDFIPLDGAGFEHADHFVAGYLCWVFTQNINIFRVTISFGVLSQTSKRYWPKSLWL